MKSTAIMTAVLAAATLAAAQANPSQSQPPAPGTAPQGQSGTAAGQSSTPAPAAQPPAGGQRVLQAKSQEELKAYQDVTAKTDPALVEAGADDFAAKYPSSELRASLYIRAMNLYAQANNSEKVIVCGRKAIAADPTNPIPLVQVASALAETTRDTDIDREQRMAEAAKDAHAAIDNIDTGLIIPANADQERVAGAKHSIVTMAYDTLGMIDMNKNDYSSAATNFQKAIDESKSSPEAVLYLRLSVAQDKLKEYPQALDSANKALQYAKEGTPAQNLAKQQQDRLQKLMSAGSPAAGPTSPAASPMSPGAPGAQPGQQQAPGSPMPPH
jgi:tetratricopeptide (TPR) repeat protein